MRNHGMLPLIAGALLAALPAHAVEPPPVCGPLKLFNEVQLQFIDNGLRPMIPVRVDGHEQLFIFDTGNGITTIGERTAKSLDITVRNGGRYAVADILGNLQSRYASLSHFDFGKRTHGSLYMPIWPNLETDMAGSFGLDFMVHYDTDIDFGTGTLRMFDRDHCSGNVVYWQASAVGVVPIAIQNGHITVSVTVDGHPIAAILDTGAENTTMTRQVARDIFGITEGAQGMERSFELHSAGKSAQNKVLLHVFDDMAFGDIAVKNAHVLIMPDLMSTDNPLMSRSEAGVRRKMGLTMPDMIIGMNILRKLHLYLAFGEGRLYVSPASVTTAASGASSESQAAGSGER
jgi:predicted aspartyl protease